MKASTFLSLLKGVIALVYGLLFLQMIIRGIVNLLQDWRTWLALALSSVFSYLVLCIKGRPKAAPRQDSFERQPHDPAPRHVDAQEWG